MHVAIVAASFLVAPGSGAIPFTAVTVDVTDAPRRLDAGDVDGDGDVDLVLIAKGPGVTHNLQVLLNAGGTFVPGWSTTGGTGSSMSPWDIDLADTDGDGDLDLLYLVPSGSELQRFNDGDGNFDVLTGIPGFSLRVDQEPADMDGDGDGDVVYYEEDIFFDVYFGTLKGFGNGSFSYSIEVGWLSDIGLASRIGLGDVNADGLRDAALASKHFGLRFLRGTLPTSVGELPGWTSPVLIYATNCLDVVMVDLHGNGRLDIAASVPSLDAVALFAAGPSATFGTPRLFPAGEEPDAMTTADLDFDGTDDVVVTNPETASVHVLRGTGSGGFEAAVPYDVGTRPTDVVAADLDGDGDIDLAVTCAAPGQVTLLVNATL